MIGRFALVACAMMLLVGCDSRPDAGSAGLQQSFTAAAPGGIEANEAKLAYRHQLGLEMPEASVQLRFEAARDRCLGDAQLGCVLVNASIDAGGAQLGRLRFDQAPRAQLTVRLPHRSIAEFERGLLAAMPSEGAGEPVLRSRSTSAEDLSQTIADVTRRLAQLTDYRERLTVLAARSDARVEDVIKVAAELSSVQSQIEALDAQQRGLAERVATEIVAVSFASHLTLGSAWAPVAQTWSEGGRMLGESAAATLAFVIRSLPWLPLVGLIVLALAKLRPRFRRIRP
jgi:hypothetical protein